MSTATKRSKNDEKERSTVYINPKLLKDAKAALGVDSTVDAIEAALTRIVQQTSMQELADLVGTPDPEFTAAPRRRPQ